MTRLPVVLAAAAMLPATAHAWKHSDPYFAWLPEDMPIPYVTQAECEDSVPQEYCDEMVAQVYDDWRSVPCVDYDFVYDGEYGADGVMFTHDPNDPRNHWVYDDPSDSTEVGVLGVTLVHRFGVAFQLFGETYLHADNGDIAFNDNVDFATHEEIVGGQCNGRTNMRSVALHEAGHFMGLGHSCDEGESSFNCPKDCQQGTIECGNGTCDEGENDLTCPEDCPKDEAKCPDGECQEEETFDSCPEDCADDVAVCGNKVCEEGETDQTCPADCKTPEAVCGNGQCDEGETKEDCPEDCKN